MTKKVEAIEALTVPKTCKQLRQFIGMINFYRDMWQKRSELLAPLTALTSKNVKYDWKDEHQKFFEAIKSVIGREVLLGYPDFNAPLEIHTDASKLQLGTVIYQKGKPIAFYSIKINSAQQNYTTTEKELLSIVETLKEFHNILLGHQITVYTDNKNLTNNFFNKERVMRWCLILEEFDPEFKYTKRENNIVDDALSRLEKSPNQDIVNISDLYGYDDKDLPDSAYQIRYHDIAKAQETDAKLQQKIVSHKDFTLNTFRGGDKDHRLICQSR